MLPIVFLSSYARSSIALDPPQAGSNHPLKLRAASRLYMSNLKGQEAGISCQVDTSRVWTNQTITKVQESHSKV